MAVDRAGQERIAKAERELARMKDEEKRKALTPADEALLETMQQRQRRGVHYDADRGVSIRSNGKGVTVFAYRDEPGTWYSKETGEQVSDEVARQAGFDVAADRFARLKVQKLAAVEQSFTQPAQPAQPQAQPIEKGGFTARPHGLGRWTVTGPNGITLTPRPVSQADAMKLLAALTTTGDEANGTD